MGHLLFRWNRGVDLAPGNKSILGFQLKEKISDLLPGDYEISAIYDYNEGQLSCESSPIKLKVLPATPHNIFLASARGGASTTYYAAWINYNEEKTEVVWGQLDLVAGGGVRSVRAVEQAGIRTQPILSVPTNGALAKGQWLAWLDKDLLHYTFLQPGNDIATPSKISLNSVAAKIVGPLYYIESSDTENEIPHGEATLLLGNFPSVTIQTVQFVGKKAELGRSAIFPGGQMPAWITNVYPGNGQQLAPYILAEPGKLNLNILTWGDAGDATGITELHPHLLSSLEGDFLAAACTLDSEDVLHGAILFWAGKSEEPKELKIFLWTLNNKGKFKEDSLKAVSWNFTEQITNAEISATAKGLAVAIIRKDNGQWNYIDLAGKPHPLAGNFMRTDLALTMNFLNMVKPMVIGGVQSLGLKITEPDGTPMPNLPGF